MSIPASTSLRSSRETCTPLLKEDDQPGSPSSSINTSPCLSCPTSLIPDSCINSKALSTSLHHDSARSPRTKLSPRFSDTPEYIPFSSLCPPRGVEGPNLQVKYPELSLRASAPAVLPTQVGQSVAMPDLITFSPPVGSCPATATNSFSASLPSKYNHRPSSSVHSSPGRTSSDIPYRMSVDGAAVGRRPSFKITLPRCPNPQDLAAQVGRATGTGLPGRTYSRTPYPDEEGVDYLSRALDRVEVGSFSSASGASGGIGGSGGRRRPSSDVPSDGTPSSPPTDLTSEMGRTSSESSGRGLPVVEVSIMDDPVASMGGGVGGGGIKFVDPWKQQEAPRRKGRGMGRGRATGRRGRRHPADSDGDDGDDESADDEEEEEHLLRDNLGSPCHSPRGKACVGHTGSADCDEPPSEFYGMLARAGRG